MKNQTRINKMLTVLLLLCVLFVCMAGTAFAAENVGNAIDLSSLTATYVISDSGEYIFTGSGSYGIKVESGNPTIVLNNASIMVGEGSSIDVASGSNATIFVRGDNTIDTDSMWETAGGIFVAEGGTVNITSNGTDNILRAHGTLAAAIGGKYDYDNNESYNAGSISISNVTVYAYTNNFHAAAIGAAGEGTCGTINITNAVVYAYGAGDRWTSAPGIGSAWSLVSWSETIPVVIISDSEVHTFRHNSGSDYIGYLGDVEIPMNATGSINCGEGGSITNSTIYCYTGLDSTTTDKTVKYGTLGGLLKEDGTCEGEHSGGTATCTTLAVCENCGASYGERGNHSTAAEGDRAATCKELAYCSVCQKNYGEVDSTNHASTEFTYTANEDGTTHKKAHKCCDATAAETEAHTLDVTTGKCGACGADMTVVATVTDGTNTYYAADAATLNQAVTAILETGSRTFTVELPANAEAGMITAIRRAICDTEGVADGSIHLTLKGVTTIPGTTNWDGVAFGPRNAQWDENNVEIVSHEEVTQLASVNLPDVTEIGAQAFYFCENLVAVSAPKAQTIGAQALGYTALTSVEFPELTSIPTDMFSGTWTLSSAKFPKVTTIEQGGLLVGAKFAPENNPTPFPLELTAEDNITFNGSNHFNIASQNYSGKVDLVLCCDKADKVTKNEDGTATWQVRDDLSYTFKSITFKHSYVDGKCTACGEDCAHTGGTATCTTPAVCDLCGESYGELGSHSFDSAGTCTGCQIKAKAKLETYDPELGKYVSTYYATFPEALAAVTGADCSIEALADYDGDFELPAILYGNGYTFSGEITVDEYATIQDGNFTGKVIHNYGNIWDGTFQGEVIVKADGYIQGGTFHNTVTVETGGKITDMDSTFKGTVINNGSIYAGNFYSDVTNNGKIYRDELDVSVFYGTLTNNGTIYGGYFSGGKLINAGTVENHCSDSYDYEDGFEYVPAEGGTVTGDHNNTTEANCTSGAICSFCGEYGDKNPNNHASDIYTYTDNGAGTHGKVCTECGNVVASEPHTLTYTASGNVITATCSANCGYSETATISAENATYNGTEQTTASIAYSEGWTGGEPTVSYENNVYAGTATASITLGEATASVEFTIAKAEINIDDLVNPEFAANLVYDGTKKALVTAHGSVPGGTILYSLTYDGEYTSTIPVATEAGRYVVYWLIQGDENHEDILSPGWTQVIIAAKPGTDANVTLGEYDSVYSGTAKEPGIASVVVDGVTLTAGKDYDVSYENNVYAGTAKAVITFKGNYSGTATETFQISKAPLTVTADDKSMTTGRDLPAFTYTITGFVNGETEAVLTTKPTAETVTDGKTAGSYDITVDGAVAANYDFTYVKGTLSVVDHQHSWSFNASGNIITATCGNADGCPSTAQIIKLIEPASLAYDGSEKVVTVEGTIDGTTIEVIYSGDRRNVTAEGFSASVTLGNATATISGMKITPVPVTITGLTATERAYDGTLNVTLTGGMLNGAVPNDDVTIELTGAQAVMADANAGENKSVTVNGVKLGGATAGNYELLEQPTGVTVNITTAPLTIKSATIADVLYREDGNYTLTVTGVAFDGLVNGENLMLGTDYTAAAQLTGANAADTTADATVTVTLSNTNYSLAQSTYSAKVNLFTHKHNWSFSVNGDTITAACGNTDSSCPVPQATANIQLVAPTDENLIYDGQHKIITVVQNPNGTFSDLPTVSYCCADGCINAGEHTASLTYGGVIAEKKFTISQKDITGATIGTFAEMAYNGAAQTPAATVTIGNLAVTGTWSAVTNVSDKTTFTASGNFAGTIADQTTGMKKAAPTAADFTFAPPANPVYDGSEKAASVTTDKSGMGVISIIYYRNGGDAPVTPADAGEYLVAINVTEGENYLSASSLRAESWKFTITQTQTAMTAKTDDMTYVYGEVITVTGTADVPQPEQQGFNLLRAFTGPKAQQVALYDASGNQLTDGVDVVNGAYTITYDTKLKGIDPGQELTLTVQFVGDANMSNRSVATNKFTLNTKSISPVVSGTVTKAYDGTTAVPANHNLTISLTDKIDGDTVNASGSFAYADAIVGTGKAINTTGIILSGTDAKFYMLSTDSASSAVGEITKAKLNGVTAPADQTLNVYCMNATAAIAQLPTTVTYSVEGGGTIALNISWSCDSYNNTPNAENTFTWSVNDAEKLACYAPNTGVATSGSINVKNSAAIPVTLTGTPVTITYSGTTYDVSAMFTIGQGAGTPSYEIVTGGTGEGTLNGSALTITKAGTFTVKLTTAANGAYAASTATAVLTVEKGIPTVTAPTGLAAYYSQTLSQITLPADANGTWSWADGNTLVGEVGQRVHKAIFTPKDTNLWHAIYVDVTINVVQAGTVFVGDVGVYNGETATKAFTYGDTITVKVKPAAAQPATFSLRSLLAPQKDQMALYIRANGTDTQITNPVTADKNGIFTMEYVTTGKALVIGNNKLVAKYVGNDNMAAQEQEIEVTLAQKELSFVSITAQSRAYEQGNNQVFVTGAELNGVESGDSVTLDTAGLTASVSSDAVNTYYSAMLPAGISLTGNDAEYYFITGSVSVTVAQGGVEITEKQPAALTFELSQTSFVYNRNEQKPTVTIKDGESILTAGMDYDITWPENCIDVGEKAILITFKGNYSGEVTLTYEIVAQIPTIIVKQPTDQFVVEGQRAEFSIEATGAGLTYQWYINRNDGRGWRDIEGAIGAVYITSVTDLECDGFQYGCLITDQYGNTLKSDVAVLHVSKVPVLPETGDSSTPMLWLAMSILSMAGILLLRKKAYSR